ncbi:response regulator [Neopusillimonas aromaticivorans]|uniref:response regulator n=1 Tax=Neopusillimonas aromaticivorans TaxID=2979868 RepID=UPI0025992E1F|nr:response regulator [Neopusillimonas aromaticivorans]WJJ94475.1 response regulator [Neopusillimonas aromaticivorans]
MSPGDDPVNLSGKRILVVDDEPLDRRVMVAMLEILNGKPDVATSGPEAVFKARLAAQRGEPYDLVMVDTHMPGTNGYDTAAQLLQAHAGQLCILMATASAESGDARRCKALGLPGYLTKPVTLQELRRVLGLHLPGCGCRRKARQVPVCRCTVYVCCWLKTTLSIKVWRYACSTSWVCRQR